MAKRKRAMALSLLGDIFGECEIAGDVSTVCIYCIEQSRQRVVMPVGEDERRRYK
jgi:hypothetical protein